MHDLSLQAQQVSDLLDPISQQIAKTLDSDCDPEILLALVQLRKEWHLGLCALLREGLEQDHLPPEELVGELIQDLSQETKLLQQLALRVAGGTQYDAQQYAWAWMQVRQQNELLIDFYTDQAVE